ncbi:MAG: 6-bladed beta-propeller [Tannerellaceae bacterium]|jgi:hypothetical protein|nr:6-bladed beta-propeller [Tannerellaceae bacterium]
MKRAFLALTLFMIALYGRLGYELFTDDLLLKSSFQGSLSDIAETVTAIPLQPAAGEAISDINCLRQEKDNLFLVSNRSLYRFHASGAFICRITNPEVIQVAGYVIDQAAQRLIVLGNEDDIHYYSFTGELLDRKKITGDEFHRIHSILMHDNYIWTTEENVRFDLSTGQFRVEQQAVKYDSSFQKIEAYELSPADLPHKPFCSSFLQLELAIAADTGQAYAYSPPFTPGYLLQDSLLLRRRQLTPGQAADAGGVSVYPLRFGGRYWLSCYHNPAAPAQGYTFCFDRDSGKSWQIAGGFDDDFYHTGRVSNLQALDACGNSYYYSQPGAVFIIRLKG